MGVISLLGWDQAELISKKLLDTLGAETVEKRQIVCGDGYAFQGDERDIMFLIWSRRRVRASRGSGILRAD